MMEFVNNAQSISSHTNPQTQQTSTIHTRSHIVNKNIEELKKLRIGMANFYDIFDIFKKITEEIDTVAMSFAVRNKYGEFIFPRAVYDNLISMIRLMLLTGIGTNLELISDELISASREGHYEIVKLLLTVPGIDVNARFFNGNTALIVASCNGHYEVVKLLLTFPGIDVNAKGCLGWTALRNASYNGRNQIVKLLLTYPWIDDISKSLHFALIHEKVEVIKMLKDYLTRN